MPELPEVETTRRGLSPLVVGRRIQAIEVRQPALRWPIPTQVASLAGEAVHALDRRGKWLIWRLDSACLLWHLGMSGSFRGWGAAPEPGPHDHVDVQVENGHLIRYTDPRRFGALLLTEADPLVHPRLAGLGPEPLGTQFDGDHLWHLSRGRRAAVKSFIMDSRIVVGVGNIYACEALFDAGIHPGRAAGRVSRKRYHHLAETIRTTLAAAIEVGGTSLRDFTVGDGTPGYFGQQLKVYGREGQPCPACGLALRRSVIGQRSTFYCLDCQR